MLAWILGVYVFQWLTWRADGVTCANITVMLEPALNSEGETPKYRARVLQDWELRYLIQTDANESDCSSCAIHPSKKEFEGNLVGNIVPVEVTAAAQGSSAPLSGSPCTAYVRVEAAPRLQMPEVANPLLDTATEMSLRNFLDKMTLEEKVGQMIMTLHNRVTAADLAEISVGAVFAGGGTFVAGNTARDWRQRAQELHEASTSWASMSAEAKTRLGIGKYIPILFAADAGHGHTTMTGATSFPHNINIGATNSSSIARKVGEVVARELAASGVDWMLGPPLSLPENVRWGRVMEAFSQNLRRAGRIALGYVKGLQGKKGTASFLADDRVMATAKHWLGDGATIAGQDVNEVRTASLGAFLRRHAALYRAAVESNVLSVMVSMGTLNGMRLHAHRYALTSLLKEQLGFKGIVLGDWDGHHMVPTCFREGCAHAINAGLDMIMVPGDWKAFFSNTVQQVKDGTIRRKRIDDAVLRILRVKSLMRKFDPMGKVKERSEPTANVLAKIEVVGSAAHEAIAREAARGSIVLLHHRWTQKNRAKALLPLAPSEKVLLVGNAAASVALQNGGWTYFWQGVSNLDDLSQVPVDPQSFGGRGKTLLSAMRQLAENPALIHAFQDHVEGDVVDNLNHANIDYDAPLTRIAQLARRLEESDVAVLAVAEPPYAEYKGDITPERTLSFEQTGPGKYAVRLARAMRELQPDMPLVTVLFTGRPLMVNELLETSDAFIAAFLPGTEGGPALADLLYGRSDFTGTLPFDWPVESCKDIFAVKEPRGIVVDQSKVMVTPFLEGFGLRLKDGPRDMPTLPNENSAQCDTPSGFRPSRH